MNPLLELRNVSKSFGGLQVNSDVSFSLGKGDRVALIGPNGAGKTTLVNVISGDLAPTKGSVVFEGNDVSAVSFHKMMQTIWKLDAVSDWGSVVALTYIAAQRVFPDYSEMAESKALLESFARSFGYHIGTAKHIRVNTISQSPTMTTAGKGIKGFQEFYDYADKMSPMGNAPAEACADYCIAMFSDLTRYVTMQNLFHDGGFSNMGMNPAVIGL